MEIEPDVIVITYRARLAGRRAMARGVKFGRPQAFVARSYRVDPATISRLAATL